MVAGKTPDELPPGWKEHLKVSGGRKIKYYTSAESVKRFYSKKSVISYINMKDDSSSTPQPETINNDNSSTPQLETRKNDSSGTPQPQTGHVKEGSGSKVDFGGVGTDESPAWLPQGWMVEVRARKSGLGSSTYKIYTDPSTGSKFYSKPEVFRYLESLDQSKSKNQTTDNTAVDKSSSKTDVSGPKNLSKSCGRKPKKEKNSSSKPPSDIVCSDVVESRSVDELSVGWLAEFKIIRHAHGIQIDAYYTDPVSGYVFQSEKDVFCYLETGDITKCAIRPKKKDVGDSKSTKYVNSKSTIEKSIVKNDLSERHLLESGQGSISDKKRNSIGLHSRDLVETTSADGLPPGWIKEVKTTRNAHGIRRDPYYTDPVSGYIFRSKRDAWRYIETGDINKCVMKPKKRDGNDPEPTKDGNSPEPAKDGNNPESTKDASSPSTPVDKRYSLRSSRGQLSIGNENCAMSSTATHKSESSKRIKVDDVPTDVVVTESVAEVPGKKQLSRRGRKSRKTAQSSEPESKDSKQDSIVSADVQAVSNAGVNNMPGKKLPKTSRKQKSSRKATVDANKSQNISRTTPLDSKKSKKRIAQSFPGRMSKRLAGSQPELPANLELSERSLRAAIKKSCESEDDILSIINMNSAANGASQLLGSDLASETAVRRSSEVEHNILPMTTMNTITVGPQPLDPEPAAGVADIVSMVVQSISKIEESDKSEEPSAENQAVPEEKTGSQVNEKQNCANPNNRNPQGTYPFLDSWPDPCLDFAFKTLTGAIPVDNKVGYQGSSQNQSDTTSSIQRKGYYQNQTETSSSIQRNEYFRQSESQRSAFFQNGTPSLSLNSLNPVDQHVRVEQSPRSPASIPPGFGLPFFGGTGSQQRSTEDRTSIPPGFGSPTFGGINSQQQSTEARTSIPPGFGLPIFGGFSSQQRSSEAKNDSQRKY